MDASEASWTNARSKWNKKVEQARNHLRAYRFNFDSLIRAGPGVGGQTHGPEIIVSLTTTAFRLRKVHLTIETLLQQSRKPHRLILWLSDEFQPGDLPAPLRRQQSRGLEVRFRRELRVFTKLIHALREHPASTIVTADDDTFYPRDWLRQLHQSWQRQPEFVHCQRAHLMREAPDGSLKPYLEWDFLAPGQTGPSMWLFPTGVGGVLYPPGSLHPEVGNEDAFLKLTPSQDDVWFKAMALLAGVATVKVSPAFREYPTVPGTQRQRLSSFNWADGNCDAQLWAVFEHYKLLPLARNVRLFSGGLSSIYLRPLNA